MSMGQHRPRHRHDKGKQEVGPLFYGGEFGEFYELREQARLNKYRIKAICIGIVLFGLLLLSLPYWP